MTTATRDARITFRLTRLDAARLSAIADRRGVTVSKLIQDAVRRVINQSRREK